MASTMSQQVKEQFLLIAGTSLSDSPPPPSMDSSPSSPVREFIPTLDKFWDFFFTKPQTASDIFSLISTADIRYVRDCNRVNFLTFVRVLIDKIIKVSKAQSSFSKDKFTTDILVNAIRFLTMVLPVLFEDDDNAKSLFWSVNFGIDADIRDINAKLRSYSPESTQATVGSYSSSSASNKSQSNGSSLTSSSLKANIDAKIRYSPQSMANHVGGKRQDCLGIQLVTSLVDLLFWRGFTLEKTDMVEEGQISSDLKTSEGFDLKIWEVGIGMNGKYSVPNPEIDSNRLEVLRLIITLCSIDLYVSSKEVVSKGSRFLTVLVSVLPRLKFLTFICSLLNLVCRSIKVNDDVNGLKYNGTNPTNKHLRKALATNSLHLLTIMLVYPLPSTDTNFLFELGIFPMSEEYTKPINLVRSYLGKLHKENELNFLYQSIFQFLNKPIESAIENEASPFNILSKNTGQSNSLPQLSGWSIQIVMLLWELIQCNKNFKKFVISKKSNELMVTLLYYLKYYKNQPKLRMNLIRVISFLFLYLSANESVLKKLLLPFNNNYYVTKIPSFYKLNNHQNSSNITYRDFIVITISNMLINLNEFDDLITPTFFECLYNLIPINSTSEDLKIKATLSYHSCLAIMNVISTYASSSQILLKDSLKLDLFTLLLRSVTNSICRYFKESRTLMYLILKHEKLFQNLLKLLEDYKIDSEAFDPLLENSGDIQPYTPSLAPSSPRVTGTPQLGTPLLQPSTPVNERPDQTDDEASEVENDDFDPNGPVFDEFEECLRPKLPVGMSLKAKSKLPMDVSLVTNWSGYKSLTILLKLIKFINNHFDADLNNGTNVNTSKFEIMEVLIKIENMKPILDEKFFAYLPPEFKSEFEPLKFNWSELSLGWYSSILWSEIYLSNNLTSIQAVEQQASLSSANWFTRKQSTYSIKDVASSWGFNWRTSSTSNANNSGSSSSTSSASNSISIPKGLYATTTNNNNNNNINPESPAKEFAFDIGILTLNIWHGTAIKLFKIKKDTNSQTNGLSDLMKKFKIITTDNNTSVNNNNNNATHGSTGNVNTSGVNSHRLSTSSPYNLTPITSRQSFGTPRNSIAGPPTGVGMNELSRISSRHSMISAHDL